MAVPDIHTTPATETDIQQPIMMTRKEKMTAWFKRLGWAAFWFFVIKGTISTILILFVGKKAWESLFE